MSKHNLALENSVLIDPPIYKNKAQLQFMLVMIFLNIIEGIDGQILAVSVPAIAKEWGLPVTDFKTAMALGFAGSAVGTVIGGIFGDKIGRKKSILIGAVIFTLGTFLLSICQTPTQVLFARTISGLGLGICFPPTLALVAECLSPQKRGFAVGLVLLCHPVGIAISGTLGAWIIPDWGWRSIFVLCALASLMALTLVFSLLNESPVWLERNKNLREQASIIRKKLNLQEPVETYTGEESKGKESFFKHLSGAQRFYSLMLFLCFFSVYLVLTGVLSWIPSFLSGIGFSLKHAAFSVTIWSIAGAAGTFAAGAISSKYGATKAASGMMLSAILACILLSLIGYLLPSIDLLILTVFYVLMAFGGFAVSGVVTGLFNSVNEFFDGMIRARGVGFASTFGKIGGITGAFGGASLMVLDGVSEFFLLAMLPLLLCFLAFNVRFFFKK